jgi:hypothetical protein
MDAPPIETCKQRLKLNPRQTHDPIANLSPSKTTLF